MAKAVALRAVRAFITGALSAITVITVANVHVWSDLIAWVNMLGLAAVVGGINGVLMGADKWWRSM